MKLNFALNLLPEGERRAAPAQPVPPHFLRYSSWKRETLPEHLLLLIAEQIHSIRGLVQ